MKIKEPDIEKFTTILESLTDESITDVGGMRYHQGRHPIIGAITLVGSTAGGYVMIRESAATAA